MTQDPLHPADIVMVDRVDRPDYSAAVRYSVDGGHGWHPSALQVPAESAYQGSPCFAQADFGSRIALLTTNGRRPAARTDTRMGNAGSGNPDIYLADIDVSPPAPPPPLVPSPGQV